MDHPNVIPPPEPEPLPFFPNQDDQDPEPPMSPDDIAWMQSAKAAALKLVAHYPDRSVTLTNHDVRALFKILPELESLAHMGVVASEV